ncbi:MAG: Hpt domain-containing protein [Allomuricauda sp.]|nr:MAG: Hpt domain-containing protein [Allomuricauda sp.]
MKETPNLNYVDEVAGGDMEFRQKYITILKEEFPQEMNDYLAQLQLGELKEASLIVHKIKHKLNSLGLNDGHSLAVKHEFELRNDINLLSGEFTEILRGIESYLKTL